MQLMTFSVCIACIWLAENDFPVSQRQQLLLCNQWRATLLDAGIRRKIKSQKSERACTRSRRGGVGGRWKRTHHHHPESVAAAAVRLSGYFAVVSAAGWSVCSHFIIPQHITWDVTGTRNNEKRLRRRIRFQGGWLHKQKRIKRRRQRLFLQELLLS